MILMNNLTTKQKIIIGAIVGVMVLVIGVYGYGMLQGEKGWDQDVLSSSLDTNLESEVMNQEDNSANSEELGKENNVMDVENIESTNESGSSLAEEKINNYKNLEGKIVVHITGAVQRTGILALPEGARIADAIDAAGGITEEADLDEVNLAYELQDGQKIYIPSKEDKTKLESKAYIMSGSGNNVVIQTVSTEGNLESKGEKKVNINTATQNELENLPGIGPSIASRIIEYRQQNGKFSKIEDLQNVKGIGDAKFGKIKEYVVIK